MSLVPVILAAYLGAGLLFAIAFVWKGAARIDDAADGGSLGFRALIFPGVVALWPVLLRRWLESGRQDS